MLPSLQRFKLFTKASTGVGRRCVLSMRGITKSFFGGRVISLLLVVVTGGCAVHFANAERQVPSGYRKIYLPSATDKTTTTGHASRVSRALRRQLSLDTRYELTSWQEARWALDISVVEASTSVGRVATCLKGVGTLASGAVDCGRLSFHQARVSAEEETMGLKILARAIDLTDGKVLFSKTYPMTQVYAVVGDADTQTNLKGTPQLHALRYLENRDDAVSQMGEQVAAQISADLMTMPFLNAPSSVP